MTYQAVIFDLGGVVVNVESDRLIHQVSQLVGRSYDEVVKAVYLPELLIPFEMGQLLPEQYYEGLRLHLGLSWNFDQFVRVWNDIIREKKDTIELIDRLLGRCKLSVLSNTNILHLEYTLKLVPILRKYDDIIGSFAVGMVKPDPAIYQLAVERLGVHPKDAVYVDDRPEMVAAGQGQGLKAIRFQSADQLEKDLLKLGLLE